MSPLAPEDNCSGYCRSCGTLHSLPHGRALHYAHGIIDAFRTRERLDYWKPAVEADPDLSFDRLFSENNGHMFGVLEAVDSHGRTHWLKAFSSLRGGRQYVDGWVPPILPKVFHDEVVKPGEFYIKEMTKKMSNCTPSSAAYQKLFDIRRTFSQSLMAKIHNAYRLTNVRGETRPLVDVFIGPGGMPGGTGACCAPKLIHYAANHRMRPISIAEFYWGPVNEAVTRWPGQFVGSCASRCQPILGFMLCGL